MINGHYAVAAALVIRLDWILTLAGNQNLIRRALPWYNTPEIQ